MTDTTPEPRPPAPRGDSVSNYRPVNWEQVGERVGAGGVVGAALARAVLFVGEDREGGEILLLVVPLAGVLGLILGGLLGLFFGWLEGGWRKAVLWGGAYAAVGGLALALAGLAFGLVAWGCVWLVGTWQVGVANWIVVCVAGGLLGVLCGVVYLAVTGVPRRTV